MMEDVEKLSGRFPHRGANTRQERAAAEYVHERLQAYTSDTEIDDFHAISGAPSLFAAYYVEFLFVALVGTWWPLAALAYGAVVFGLYLAESAGYRLMARFLAQYESQNVVGRFLGTRPAGLIVVTAHIDSGKTGLISHPRIAGKLRLIHSVLLVCMFVVLATCVAQHMNVFTDAPVRVDLVCRWVAVAALLSTAGLLFFGDRAAAYVRGANTNASGVAVLLELAERLKARPLEGADVWLVATGSKETWMQGMDHLVRTYRPDQADTFFLNIAHVGAGRLIYTIREGFLHGFPSSKEMVEAATAVAGDYEAAPARFRSAPSDAMPALAKRYKAMSIMGVGEDKLPAHWRQPSDTPSEVDETMLRRAADFSEAVLRELEQRLA